MILEDKQYGHCRKGNIGKDGPGFAFGYTIFLDLNFEPYILKSLLFSVVLK